ncbi:MAG: hypothetical protein HY905_25680 [Deltaproteobacteria bacterium]|nr:hypothetical protein [Deltaproteobacteria bacterium]
MSDGKPRSPGQDLPFFPLWEWEILGSPIAAVVTDPGPFPQAASEVVLRRDEQLGLAFSLEFPPGSGVSQWVSDQPWQPEPGKLFVRTTRPLVALWEERNIEITIEKPFRRSQSGRPFSASTVEGEAVAARFRVRDDRTASSVSLWLANGPGSEFFWSRTSERRADTTLTARRADGLQRVGSAQKGSVSRDHALLDLGRWGKILLGEVPHEVRTAPLPPRKDDTHSHCLSLEFHAGLAPLPEPSIWDRFTTAVSFALGRKLVLLGATAFDQDHRIAWAEARRSGGPFVPAAFERESRPPCRIAEPRAPGDLLKFFVEDRAAEIARAIVSIDPASKLDAAFARALDLLWAADAAAVDLAPLLYMTAIDEVATGWLEAHPPSDGRSIPEGGGARRSLFFETVGIARGDVERAVKELRDQVAHGRCPTGENCLEPKIWLERAARTILHRALLGAIGYPGKYIDYSTEGEPERDLVVPLGGPAGDGKPVTWPGAEGA